MTPIALTMGDPAGIGGELSLRAWLATAPCFAVLDDPERLRNLARGLRLDVPVVEIADITAASTVFANALPVLPIRLPMPAQAGRPNGANAPAIIASIERATRLAQAGQAGAVVTNPISKAVLYDAGFRYPGHTEFLAVLTGVPGREVMMLASPLLRVVPITTHISLRRALEMMTTKTIAAAARTTHAALRDDFGITHPRLAVAGLNPHAGEGGALGNEEAEIIVPAISALRAEGLDVSGPWPPDTMFTEAARARYDAAICMYHDQALIPLKTLDMRLGVNVTLGLPIVRTSPDHGTAFDIAGHGVADPTSLIAALHLAAELAARRVSRALPPAR
ncbi:MAG TPA: 4-hydroxythreonine-4-phosphate dehydrogenase PdxA [Acetobacteraceae bacterium]